MKYTEILESYNVDYWTEGKNTRPGWVQVQCPFCDDQSNHMGLSLSSGACHCWRCGSHKKVETLAKVLSVTENEAKKLLKQYGEGESTGARRKKKEEKVKKSEQIVYPSDCHDTLKKQHIKYLEKRGLDPIEMEAVWKLKSCGPTSKIGEMSLKNRILAPICWEGEVLSWQTRAISDKKVKYITCPPQYEVTNHKDLLYASPEIELGSTGIVVEGIMDVWKLGNKAVGTFGTMFSLRQVLLLGEMFERVIILYDQEKNAQQQADLLKAKLRTIDVEAEIENPLPKGTDPGDLTYKEGEELVKSLT